MPIDDSENPYGGVQIEQDESTIIMTPQGAVNYQTWLTSTPSASASTQVTSSTTVGALARDRDGSHGSNSATPQGSALTRSSSWLHTPRPQSSLPLSGAQSVNNSSSHNRSISPGQADEEARHGDSDSQGKKKKTNKKKSSGKNGRGGDSARKQTKAGSKRKRTQSDDVDQGGSGGSVQQPGTGVQTTTHDIQGSDAPPETTLPPYMKLKSTLPEEEMDEGRLSATERTKRSKLRMNARNEVNHYFYQRTENILPDSEETLKEYTPEALLACLTSLLREKRGCDGYQESISISADNRGSRPAKPAYEPYHFEKVVYWPYFMTQERYKKAIKTRTRRLSEDDDEEEGDENDREVEDAGEDDEDDEDGEEEGNGDE